MKPRHGVLRVSHGIFVFLDSKTSTLWARVSLVEDLKEPSIQEHTSSREDCSQPHLVMHLNKFGRMLAHILVQVSCCNVWGASQLYQIGGVTAEQPTFCQGLPILIQDHLYNCTKQHLSNIHLGIVCIVLFLCKTAQASTSGIWPNLTCFWFTRLARKYAAQLEGKYAGVCQKYTFWKLSLKTLHCRIYKLMWQIPCEWVHSMCCAKLYQSYYSYIQGDCHS